jgi:hypothetical protein
MRRTRLELCLANMLEECCGQEGRRILILKRNDIQEVSPQKSLISEETEQLQISKGSCVNDNIRR